MKILAFIVVPLLITIALAILTSMWWCLVGGAYLLGGMVEQEFNVSGVRDEAIRTRTTEQ